MILVDTSVWIRYVANRAPYAAELEHLLDLDEVVAHEMVCGELLIGDSGGRSKLLTAYRQIVQTATIRHREVVEFAQIHKLHGRGIGWIDVHLLASAIVARCQLWTADLALAEIAHEFGISYKIAKRC